jgi:hypothetical protein
MKLGSPLKEWKFAKGVLLVSSELAAATTLTPRRSGLAKADSLGGIFSISGVKFARKDTRPDRYTHVISIIDLDNFLALS